MSWRIRLYTNTSTSTRNLKSLFRNSQLGITIPPLLYYVGPERASALLACYGRHPVHQATLQLPSTVATPAQPGNHHDRRSLTKSAATRPFSGVMGPVPSKYITLRILPGLATTPSTWPHRTCQQPVNDSASSGHTTYTHTRLQQARVWCGDRP